MSECNHDCAHCSANCSSRNAEDLSFKTNELSNIKKVIGIVSGKGGVGKSSVTSLTASLLAKAGYKVAILDADITGPSIPTAFGLEVGLYGDESGNMIPQVSSTGIKIISTNLILESASQPVLWRGPIIAGVVKQFFSQTNWGDIDFMLVDLPPGTGDVPLTVFQSLPLDGVLIVSTPQQLVGVIVEKAINMARMMNVPILGLVENMSYVTCPTCNERIELFGSSHSQQLANEYGVNLLAQLPLLSDVTLAMDQGTIENCQVEQLNVVLDLLKNL